MKCVLGVKVGELLSPQRGLALLRIDAADMGADVWGPSHCVGLETAPLLQRQGSAMRTLVREAREAERLCDEHEHATPWRTARAPLCTSCLSKESRPESWKLVVSGKDMEIRSCAVSLCPQCTEQVYGVSKALKHARLDCAHCRSAMDVLVARLGRMDVAQYVGLHVATEAAAVDRATMPLPEADVALVAKRCMDEYLEHTVQGKKAKVPRTSRKGRTLASFRRCDTSKCCCPGKSGVPVMGAYDTQRRGIEQSSGVPMRYEKPSKYVMGHEGAVLTTAMAKEAGLDKIYVDAASRAYTQSFPALTLKIFESPRCPK